MNINSCSLTNPIPDTFPRKARMYGIISIVSFYTIKDLIEHGNMTLNIFKIHSLNFNFEM